MLQRGWEEEATAWYAMADRKSDAYAAQVRIAHSFAAEAQARRDGGGGQAMAARILWSWHCCVHLCSLPLLAYAST